MESKNKVSLVMMVIAAILSGGVLAASYIVDGFEVNRLLFAIMFGAMLLLLIMYSKKSNK